MKTNREKRRFSLSKLIYVYHTFKNSLVDEALEIINYILRPAVADMEHALQDLDDLQDLVDAVVAMDPFKIEQHYEGKWGDQTETHCVFCMRTYNPLIHHLEDQHTKDCLWIKCYKA